MLDVLSEDVLELIAGCLQLADLRRFRSCCRSLSSLYRSELVALARCVEQGCLRPRDCPCQPVVVWMELWIIGRHCINRGCGEEGGGAGRHRARGLCMNRGRGYPRRAAQGLGTWTGSAHGSITGLGVSGVRHQCRIRDRPF
eukprot:scaffold207709_cov30-Tisochrysis_lutea.AAC.3